MKTPSEIVQAAIYQYKPVAYRVGFSGGGDSMTVVHWMMTNVPGTEVFHCNTGIGIEAARVFVRETCKFYGWPLHEIRAKEDCGQDYDEIVKKYGFPGPDGHQMMYSRLKERPIRKLVKAAQHARGDRVLIATGMRRDESTRRMRYVGREVNKVGSQIWVNPIYWFTAEMRDYYRRLHKLPRNPVSDLLGMSGECLCGAYAHKGEKALIRIACPETAARLDALEQETLKRGFRWGWEGKPDGPHNPNQRDMFMPMCVGCGKMDAPA